MNSVIKGTRDNIKKSFKSLLLGSLNSSSTKSRTLVRQSTMYIQKEVPCTSRKARTGKGGEYVGVTQGQFWSCDLRGKGWGTRDIRCPLTSRNTPEVRTARRHQPQRRHWKSSVALVKAYWLHNQLNSPVPFLQDANHHHEIDLQWVAFETS